MFESGYWFAWFPVRATGMDGAPRIAWLETVFRDRATTGNSAGHWRYYAD